MTDKNNLLKRDIKDIIFHEAIATQENLPKIYEALGFNDFETENSNLELTTLKTLWINYIINDLSFFSKKDQRMVFLEAQLDWNIEDLERFAEYVVSVLEKYGLSHNDFRNFRIDNEIFILSTSGNEPKKETYFLSDLLGESQKSNSRIGNFKFSVISRKNGNVPENTIIDEYFRFCEIQMEIFHQYGRNKQAFEKLIQRCIDEDVLKDFIMENRERIMINLDEIYNQEKYTKKLIEESNKKIQTETAKRVEAETTKKVKAETKDTIIKNLKKLGINDKEIYSAVYES